MVATAKTLETAVDAVEALPQGQRVLVAEDNAVTNDLLRLLLSQRGHSVDIVQDGPSALKALQEHDYDVVLMDFHLPEIDGIEVAKRFREQIDAPEAPRFVAITADMKGLLGHESNCETFDTVVPKPLNLDNVCKVVEGELILPESARPTLSQEHGAKNSKHLPDADAGLRQQGYRFFRWPDDLEMLAVASGRGDSLDAERLDGVLICERAMISDLGFLWKTGDLHLLPIVDLSGTLGPRADLDASKIGITDTEAVERLVNAFDGRRKNLSQDFHNCDTLGDKLLGRIHVCGSDLAPHYWPEDPTLVAYNVALPSSDVQREADALATAGLLQKRFFDRVHQCDRCSSSRLHVREECRSCGSANLGEESYLHHFVCAHQGLESDFRKGNDLVCPKCRRELTHFSVDYDRPGSMVSCASCGHASADPGVGFVCLDCHAHYDGEAVKNRDIHAYALNERVASALRSGRALLGDSSAVTRLSELPLGLGVTLNAYLKRFSTEGTAFALAEISYANAQDIEQMAGARQLRNTREQLLDSLREAFEDGDCVYRGRNTDYVLLETLDTEEARQSLNNALSEAAELLAHDLGTAATIYGAKELAA